MRYRLALPAPSFRVHWLFLKAFLALVALLAPACGLYWLFLWAYLALVIQFVSACKLYWLLSVGYPDPCSFNGSCL